MGGDTPETSALALGKLIGTVGGLVDTIKDQNVTMDKNRGEFIAAIKDQNDALNKNRDEFMDVFKGIREDSKESSKILQEHVKEDSIHHAALIELLTWKKEIEPKVDTLWDNKNKQTGFILALTSMGALIGGGIMGFIDWFFTKK